MRYAAIDRDATSYQRPLPADAVAAMCARLLGDGFVPEAAEELGLGTYNTTLRVTPVAGEPVILRAAPLPALQFRSERALMRTEVEAMRLLGQIEAVGHLVPSLLGVDFTHELVDRDYMAQAVLPGVPAPLGLERFERAAWGTFFEELGAIARAIHEVRHDAYGPLLGEGFASWTDALSSVTRELIEDLESVSIDADDVRVLASRIERHRPLLDAVDGPRLLHGDLWTVNLFIDPSGAYPTIAGICDHDRASWGDPAADWPIRMALRRPGTERDAFWTGYGARMDGPDARLRASIYEARHVAMARLERHRLARHDAVAASYRELATVLDSIPA